MDTAYVFEREPQERIFSVSSTNTAFIVLSDAVVETTRYKAIPVYTTGPSSSFLSYNVLSATSLTTQSGSTQTAYKITNYSYALGSFTISQSNGTTVSPIGAYGQSTTSISYGPGVYDVTSRTMSDTDVTTNTTERITVTDSIYSETITNADKNIYPRLTFSATTTTSSATILSLLGVISFNTISLANP
jgi:hypothetical protein